MGALKLNKEQKIASVKGEGGLYLSWRKSGEDDCRNDSYRHEFNGQEKVDEIAGVGNHPPRRTALFWEYDTRLGRRWNLDPKPNVSLSTYATFANNPVFNSDVIGDTFRNAHVASYQAAFSKYLQNPNSANLAKVNAEQVKFATVQALVETMKKVAPDDYDYFQNAKEDIYIASGKADGNGETEFGIFTGPVYEQDKNGNASKFKITGVEDNKFSITLDEKFGTDLGTFDDELGDIKYIKDKVYGATTKEEAEELLKGGNPDTKEDEEEYYSTTSDKAGNYSRQYSIGIVSKFKGYVNENKLKPGKNYDKDKMLLKKP
jgi:hypothetical protein